MPPTPTYDALTTEQRLEIEHKLYLRIFGEPYTERSIPENASARHKEYLISCIRNAIHTRNDGRVIAPTQVTAVRELAARSIVTAAVPTIETPKDIATKVRQHMAHLCSEGKLPHRLEDYFVEAEVYVGQDASGAPLWRKQPVLADQILAPEGVQIEGLRIDAASQNALRASVKGPVIPEQPARVNGIDCRLLVVRETGIRRRQIAERHLKPIGYKHRGDRGSQGYVAFEKVRADGARLSCEFDFGTWRASVVALFGYSGGVAFRFPLQYWREGRPIEIVTGAMFARTMENISFVVSEIEGLLV